MTTKTTAKPKTLPKLPPRDGYPKQPLGWSHQDFLDYLEADGRTPDHSYADFLRRRHFTQDEWQRYGEIMGYDAKTLASCRRHTMRNGA